MFSCVLHLIVGSLLRVKTMLYSPSFCIRIPVNKHFERHDGHLHLGKFIVCLF